MPRALRFLHSYATWSYNFGKNERREKILQDVAREIGYKGYYSPAVPLGKGSIALSGLGGLMEGMVSSLPLSFGSWLEISVPVAAFTVFRALSFYAGYNHKFRGKVKL